MPLRVVNLATVWTVLFKEPGRYNWLLQYYLRAEGVTLELGRNRPMPEQYGFLGVGLPGIAGEAAQRGAQNEVGRMVAK